MQPNVETLIEAARQLPPADRRRLVEALAESPTSERANHRITEIRGIGKSLWKDVDAREYIETERDSWEN